MMRLPRFFTMLLRLALLVSACQPLIVPSATSNTASAPVVQRLQAAYSAGDVASLTAIMTPDVVVHMPPIPDRVGNDAYRAAIAHLRNATLTFHAPTTSGAQVAARYTITGTHSSFWGCLRNCPFGQLASCTVGRLSSSCFVVNSR